MQIQSSPPPSTRVIHWPLLRSRQRTLNGCATYRTTVSVHPSPRKIRSPPSHLYPPSQTEFLDTLPSFLPSFLAQLLLYTCSARLLPAGAVRCFRRVLRVSPIFGEILYTLALLWGTRVCVVHLNSFFCWRDWWIGNAWRLIIGMQEDDDVVGWKIGQVTKV